MFRTTPLRSLLGLAVATVLVAGSAACTREEPTPSPTPTVDATATEPAPTAAPTTPVDDPEPTPEEVAGALPVYYVIDDAGRPRLVREFHKLTSGTSIAGKTRAAINEMLTAGSAFDPDYTTLWPSGARAQGVTASGDTVTVDLVGATTNNVGSEAAHQAVQQLVWTATAASGKRNVVIHLDGAPVSELWGHVGTADPLRRAPAADVVHAVWLISPQHGDTVGKSVTMHVAGIVFEANMNYEIRQGSNVVKKGFVTLSVGAPAQGEAKLTIDLAPGTYVVEFFEISAKDGSKIHPDNHTITVK